MLDQVIRPERANRRVLGDGLVHQGLRERRLIALVVPEAAVTNQVDKEILLEFGAIGERKPGCFDARKRVVCIDVHDRHFEAFGQVARVERAPPVLWQRGVAELVVGDDVQRAAGRVAFETGQVERLGDDALADHGRIAMDEYRQRN